MYRERKHLTCKAKQNPSPPPKLKHSFCVSNNNDKFKYFASQKVPHPTPFYFTSISPLAKLSIITIAVGIIEFKSSMGSLRFFFSSLNLPWFLAISLYLGVPSTSQDDFSVFLQPFFSVHPQILVVQSSCSSHSFWVI